MRCLLPAALVATIAFASEVLAADSEYFPLDTGWQWEYAGDGGDAITTMVNGLQQVQGVQTIVLHWQYAGGNDGELEQYYSVGDDGSVYFHGFNLDNGDIVISYRPPFLFLPPSLNVGDRWCTVTQAFHGLNGDTPDGAPFETCSEVMAFEEREVPAGTFPSYGVLQNYAASQRQNFAPDAEAMSFLEGRDLFGRPLAAGASSPIGTAAVSELSPLTFTSTSSCRPTLNRLLRFRAVRGVPSNTGSGNREREGISCG